MRIRQQLKVTAIFFGVVVLSILPSAWLTIRALAQRTEEQRTADQIVQSANDLIYLATDYLIYPGSLSLGRWEGKYAEFTGLVGRLTGGSPERVELIRDLRSNALLLREVFSGLGPPSGREIGSFPAFDRETLHLAWSRIAIRELELVSDGLRLSRLAGDEVNRIKTMETLLILASIGLFFAYFLITFVLIQKRTLKSIADFQAGTAIIGAGDLDFRIAIGRDDEIGDLARAFNTMTEETKKRSEEREAVAQELLEHRANLERTIEERTEDLRQAKLEAEEANRLKSGFLANMSHELRTPLNSIIGFTEVLQDALYGEINDKQREYLGYIATSGRHLLDLINDVLDLAKIESGRMEVAVAPFALRTALELSITMLRERALKHSIALELAIAPEVDVVVVSDEHKLKQILFNFLSNAVKFTPDGGKVRLEARASEHREGFIDISVSDTGIGIKEEDLGRLFKEFSQLDSPLQKRYEGTGLGLALSKHLIESIGGGIAVSSEEGKGSVFTISFPSDFSRLGKDGAEGPGPGAGLGA
ncbi:MAG TPA: ATP-binding protein [Rectinemataceae bacterium]|nr:ATP-binding protein [Rectinemataceae bacterium]